MSRHMTRGPSVSIAGVETRMRSPLANIVAMLLEHGFQHRRHSGAERRRAKDFDVLAQTQKLAHAIVAGFDGHSAANPTALIRLAERFQRGLFGACAEQLQ